MATRKTKKLKRVYRRKIYDALAPLDCDGVSYEFDVSTDDFELGKFYQETGLSKTYTKWSTVFYAKSSTTGYHIHFDGRTKEKRVNVTIDYFGRSVTRSKDSLPTAESAMSWLGSFFKGAKVAAAVNARFRLPITKWSSRFNLPFTVTMMGSGKEVAIEGISMALPENSTGAKRAWLNLVNDEWVASVWNGWLLCGC